MANFGVLLSGALFAVSLIATVVMFMNAREQWQRESAGKLSCALFSRPAVVLGKEKGGLQLGDRNFARTSARGLVEGKEEWMDLAPYLGFTPQDQGDNRVRLHGSTPPGTTSHAHIFVYTISSRARNRL